MDPIVELDSLSPAASLRFPSTPQERIRLNQVLDEMPLSSSASINLKYVYLDFSVE